MDIQPAHHSTPRYATLASLALAAAMLPSCGQSEPQRTAGAPLPPTTHPQRLAGTTIPIVKPPEHPQKPTREERLKQIRSGQIVPGKARIGESRRTPGRYAPGTGPKEPEPQALPGEVIRPDTEAKKAEPQVTAGVPRREPQKLAGKKPVRYEAPGEP